MHWYGGFEYLWKLLAPALKWAGAFLVKTVTTAVSTILRWSFVNPTLGATVGAALVVTGLLVDSDVASLAGWVMVMSALVGWVLPDWMRIYIGECWSGSASLSDDLAAWYHGTSKTFWAQLWEFEQTLAGD